MTTRIAWSKASPASPRNSDGKIMETGTVHERKLSETPDTRGKRANERAPDKENRAGATLYCRAGKILFDSCTAALGLVITSPLLVICAALIRLNDGGPAIFRQRRVGQNGRPFQLIKFRTMVEGAQENGPTITVRGDARLTSIGRFLRRTKLDELPQLWNVLRGEMSLVGPRPEVPEYVSTYSERQRGVLRWKPGITGPASLLYVDEEEILAGRKDCESAYLHEVMPRKLEIDLRYCERMSFLGDVKLIAATLRAVVFPSTRSGKS
jgi:lipopolysaccharide/colanic/teichoic acid biosynthesis glycosyltransferase